MKINNKIRKPIQKSVREVLKATYFDSIPLQELFDTIKEHGMIVVQEDLTPWSGLLCGDEGHTSFQLTMNGELVKNASLELQWYKMESNRIEVCGYFS